MRASGYVWAGEEGKGERKVRGGGSPSLGFEFYRVCGRDDVIEAGR